MVDDLAAVSEEWKKSCKIYTNILYIGDAKYHPGKRNQKKHIKMPNSGVLFKNPTKSKFFN